MSTALKVIVAIVICILVWIGIGILPIPAGLELLRTVLYVLDIAGLVAYLTRFL